MRIDKQRVGLMSGTSYMLSTEFDFQPKHVKKRIHKAEKPVNLFKAIIKAITLPGEILLDQFDGSGNVGIAASITGRIRILIEKSKEYVCKILKNINDNVFRACFYQGDNLQQSPMVSGIIPKIKASRTIPDFLLQLSY